MSRGGDPGRVVVVGAAPTGLGAAHRLIARGYENLVVLEAAAEPGGLASSVVDPAGFTWDLGGHVHFSHYSAYDALLDDAVAEWSWHERESWIWVMRRFVPYPFQYNIHRLDPPQRDAILRELEAASREPAPPPRDFGAFLRSRFGETLSSIFMVPYNEKTWGYPLDGLSADWVGDRVAPPDLERLRRGIEAGRDQLGWGPNDRFRFPARGGTGAIWHGVASRLGAGAIRYGAVVVGVDTEARRVHLQDGGRVPYDTLVSTVPLDRLAAMIEPEAAMLRGAAGRLLHSSVHVLGFGLRGGRPASLGTVGWIYFPEAHSPYHRVTVFSNYASSHVPDESGTWSLLAEVCESPHRPVDASRLPGRALASLREDGLVGEDATLVSVFQRRLEHGYPTPGLERDAALSALQPALEARRVFSRGRFGGWKYEVSNQDHSFMQGVELVDRLLDGTPEITYPDPARANSGEFAA